MKVSKLIFSLILCLPVLSVSAQLTVDNSMTVEELVNNVLLGQGVTASNIEFNGVPGNQVVLQAGTFNSQNSNIPIGEGVILSTGDIPVALGPNNSGSSTIGGSGLSGDDDLALAVQNPSVNDVAIIEFDFVANADSLKFNYVFASEEYNEFVCAGVNDVFGFFISGPGISGPYEGNAANIALVPNTNVPVSINTVNIGQPGSSGSAETCAALDANWQDNSIYYVDNEGNSDPNSTQFDGFTVILTALADIECGATYHIKIAIADVQDGSYDSAVFLEAGSFSAFGEVFVNVSPTIGGAPVVNSQYDSVLVAGCSEAYIQLIRPTGLTVDTIFSEFSGTAIEGQDYELGENDTLFFFPEGVDTLNFTITTLYDGVPDEDEYLTITIFYYDGCGELDSASTTIPIVDPYHFSTSTEDVIVTCPADSTFIQVEAFDGIEPYQYDWGDAGMGSNIYAEVPLDEQYYVVGVTDACGFEIVLDSVLVTNNIPPPLQTFIDPFEQPECTNQPIALYTTTTGGNGEYTFIWTDGLNTPGYPPNPGIGVENINNIIQFNPEPLGYTATLPVYVTVIDTCGTTVSDSVQINYPFFDPISVSYPSLTDNCPKDPIALKAHVEGGAGDTEFQWAVEQGEAYFPDGSVATTPETFVVPSGGMNQFTIVATDKCNRAGYDYHYVDGNSLAFGGLATYTDSLRVLKLDHLMNVMTPNKDGKNDYFIVEGIQYFDDAQLQVFDRWGKVIYETKNYQAGTPLVQPDGSFDGTDLEDGTYFYVINVDQGECVQSGQIEILRKNN